MLKTTGDSKCTRYAVSVSGNTPRLTNNNTYYSGTTLVILWSYSGPTGDTAANLIQQNLI